MSIYTPTEKELEEMKLLPEVYESPEGEYTQYIISIEDEENRGNIDVEWNSRDGWIMDSMEFSFAIHPQSRQDVEALIRLLTPNN